MCQLSPLNGEQVSVSGLTVSRAQGQHCCVETTEEPQVTCPKHDTVSPCAHACTHICTHAHIYVQIRTYAHAHCTHTHTQIKGTLAPLLGSPVTAANTTALPFLIFPVPTHVCEVVPSLPQVLGHFECGQFPTGVSGVDPVGHDPTFGHRLWGCTCFCY